jgi:hypothetical protein
LENSGGYLGIIHYGKVAGEKPLFYAVAFCVHTIKKLTVSFIYV